MAWLLLLRSKKKSNKIALELNAQVDVAQMLDGSAAPVMNTVLPVKNTARRLLLQRKRFPWLHPKRLLNKTALELNAQEDAAQMLDGSAVLEMNTVQPVKNIARKSTLLKN